MIIEREAKRLGVNCYVVRNTKFTKVVLTKEGNHGMCYATFLVCDDISTIKTKLEFLHRGLKRFAGLSTI